MRLYVLPLLAAAVFVMLAPGATAEEDKICESWSEWNPGYGRIDYTKCTVDLTVENPLTGDACQVTEAYVQTTERQYEGYDDEVEFVVKGNGACHEIFVCGPVGEPYCTTHTTACRTYPILTETCGFERSTRQYDSDLVYLVAYLQRTIEDGPWGDGTAACPLVAVGGSPSLTLNPILGVITVDPYGCWHNNVDCVVNHSPQCVIDRAKNACKTVAPEPYDHYCEP